MRARYASLILVLCLLLPVGGAVAQEDSYAYLIQQGRLHYDYKHYAEAANAFKAACALPEGQGNAICLKAWGLAAERAGYIADAIAAWRAAGGLDEPGASRARREMGRLKDSYGSVRFVLPEGADLPSSEVTLEHRGLLVDPNLKRYVAFVARKLEHKGLWTDVLWLPAGPYDLGGQRFNILAGKEVTAPLPRSLFPFRPEVFAVRGVEPKPLAGPGEVGVAFELGLGGVPGGEVGVGPASPGLRIHGGAHVGPMRFEGRIRGAVAPTRSLLDPTPPGREGTALQLLGQADVGLDVALAPPILLTPHVGLVGGSLGQLMLPCLARGVDGALHGGECQVDAVAMGVQGGADLQVVLAGDPGRLLLRVGVYGEGLAGGTTAEVGMELAGRLGATLLRVERWRFSTLRAGVDVGVSLRF